MERHFRRQLLVGIASLFIANSAFATDGYFATGYGTKQQGQGGAGIAMPGDSLAGATNPALLVLVGDCFDLGLTYFRPIRSGTIEGNQLPTGYPNVNGIYDANRVKSFFIPELGYSHLLKPNLAIGVAIFGNGGLNTSYTTPTPLLGNTRGGVDLQQLFVSPTIAYKLNAHNFIGLAANIAYQRVSVEGLQNFASPYLSSNPANVTNTGHSNSYGAGVRVGWLGEINKVFNVGASFQTRTYSSKFGNYSGLFAEQGAFDIPANVAGGVAVKINPKATMLFDVERIFYGTVKSIANPGSNQALLGSNNGPGFGWNDINAIKTGVAYNVNSSLTIRGGYNYSGMPFANTQTFFNLLAPAVVQNHLHLRATWNLRDGKEINIAYVHAFQKTLNGMNSIPPSAGGGNANLSMYQNSIDISFGWNRNKK
jgi:long-chain fatty acid transport protein